MATATCCIVLLCGGAVVITRYDSNNIDLRYMRLKQLCMAKSYNLLSNLQDFTMI